MLSWDNLTTKGLIPFDPDAVLVWNDSHAEEARRIHGIPQDRIIVTGSPFFDKWFEDGAGLPGRDEFCRKVGLDPSRRYLAWLGSSKNIAPDEIRGASIDGGQTFKLAKGDVIIVPNGVPHWFKEISGPFLYYTVKVTDTTKPAGESTVSR